MLKNSLIAATLAASALSATLASAVTVYKITEADGSVTYQNTPPRVNQVARTQRKEINPDENVMVNERRAVGAAQSGGNNLDQTNLRALDELIRRSVAAGQAAGANNEAPAVSSTNNARRAQQLGIASGSAPNQGGAGTGALVTAETGTAITDPNAQNLIIGNQTNTTGTTSGTTTTGTTSGGTTSNFGGTTSNYGGTTSNYGGTTSNFGAGTGTSTADGSPFGTGGAGTGNTTSNTSSNNGLTTNTAPGTTVFPNGMNTDIGGVGSSSAFSSGSTSSGSTSSGNSLGNSSTNNNTNSNNTNSTANFGSVTPTPAPNTTGTTGGTSSGAVGSSTTGAGRVR